MIIINIIIYVISVCIPIIGLVKFKSEQYELENAETIRDYLGLALDRIIELESFELLFIFLPFFNTLVSIIITIMVLSVLFYKKTKKILWDKLKILLNNFLVKLKILWNKFLDIKIHKNKNK
jgi:hypothetical protein